MSKPTVVYVITERPDGKPTFAAHEVTVDELDELIEERTWGSDD